MPSGGKAIVISDAPLGALAVHVGALDLPRRACSAPADSVGVEGLRSFVELWGPTARLREIVADWPYPARAWLVSEHVPVAYEQTWESGTPSPGVRMISTLRRREGMTPNEFAAYWLGPHTEVATSYSVPVWHYNQNVVVEALLGDTGEDGFVGMHFRSAEEHRARWQDHPAEARRGANDAARFMQVDSTVSITAIETVWSRGE